ncbi:hypothetical protein [Microseira wollei]|uniref:Uncharacterized protein n=1 Tax=Microseira wollei NIES-4236 TaxID=2530354 RepID=A0AAV3WN03_9CYAN|nr:hypothetical protein [Microseira wollei]GET42999.1 hypothetical protein MiSe_78190 [Microseira wollei NIES-4236]
MYLSHNGFVFKAGGNLPSDAYYNACVPETVGLGNRVPVKIRLGQSVIVTEQQTTAQSTEESVTVTVQQETVVIPFQGATVNNPVRDRQSVQAGQEIPVQSIPTRGNQALETFNRQAEEAAGTTFLLPPAAKTNQLVRQATQTLSKEIAAQAASAGQLADEAVAATSSSIDDAARLTAKLKGLSAAQIQQILQKANIPFSQAKVIAQQAVTNADEAANALRSLGFAKIAELNKQVTQQLNRVAASVC